MKHVAVLEDDEKPKPKPDPNKIPVDNFGPFPGYWTLDMLTHDWPPGWMPTAETKPL